MGARGMMHLEPGFDQYSLLGPWGWGCHPPPGGWAEALCLRPLIRWCVLPPLGQRGVRTKFWEVLQGSSRLWVVVLMGWGSQAGSLPSLTWASHSFPAVTEAALGLLANALLLPWHECPQDVRVGRMRVLKGHLLLGSLLVGAFIEEGSGWTGEPPAPPPRLPVRGDHSVSH